MSKVYKWVKIDVCKATDRCVRHPYEVGCIFDLFGVPYEQSFDGYWRRLRVSEHVD